MRRPIFSRLVRFVTVGRVVWVALMLVGSASAASPPTFASVGEYLIRVYQTEDGLPENSATAMVQTQDGYLWFGTFNGLVRFNGVEFQTFDRSNSPGLPGVAIINLHADRAGRLWVSTEFGLAWLENGRWHPLGVKEGWTATFAKTFAEDRQGNLVVGSFDGKVFRLKAGRAEELPTLPFRVDGPKAPAAFCHFDDQGVLWAAGGRFFGRWRDGAWESVVDLGELISGATQCAIPAHAGGTWLLRDRWLTRFMDGKVVERRELPLSATPWSVFEDSQSRLWIASYQIGFLRVDRENRVDRFTTDNSLTHNSGRFVFEDAEGSLWLGTSGGGLHRFRERNFYSYGMEAGLPERVVKSVTEVSAGKLMVSSFGKGMAWFDGQRGAPLGTLEKPQPGFYGAAVLQDRRGRLWAGLYEGGLSQWDGSSFRFLKEPGFASVTIYSLFEDSQDRLWVGTQKGVGCLTGDTWRFYGPAEGLSGRSIRSFAEHRPTGTVWVGSVEGGLYRFASNRFERVALTQDDRQEQIYSLHCDDDGTVWIGTVDAGLLRWQGGKLNVFGEAEGLPARTISAIIEAEDKSLWLGSNRGVIRLERDACDSVAAGREARLRCWAFNLSDGLESPECAPGYQPSAIRDRQHRLWFCTLRGLAMVDPAKLRINHVSPPVRLERLSYSLRGAGDRRAVTAESRSGRDWPFHSLPVVVAGAGPASGRHSLQPPFPAEVVLPPGSTRIEFALAGLSFAAPEKMRFVVRLEGQDSRWVDLGNQRVAPYDNLAPGRYVFQARVANNDGVWGGLEPSLVVIQAPYLWQTLWFRALALLGFAGGVGGVVWRVQHNQLAVQAERLRQQEALARERARSAALTESTNDLVCFATVEESVLQLNEGGRLMLGLSPEPEPGPTLVSDLLPPDRQSLFSGQILPRLLQEGRWTGETSLRHRLGHDVPVQVVGALHRGPDGGFQFISIVARDITETKRAQRALQESEDRFRRTFEQAAVGIAHLASDGRFLWVNERFCEIAGRPREAALALRWDEVMHPEDVPAGRQRWQDLIVGRVASYAAEVRIIRPDAAPVWVRMTVSLARGKEGAPDYLIAVAEDITRRKLAEANQAQLETQLRQAQKMEAIGTLAGGIAHDFNNILAAIIPCAHLAKEDAGHNPAVQEGLDQILKAAERAKGLVQQILAFSRQQKQERRSIQLQPVVQEALKLLRSALPATIEIDARIDEAAPPVLADPVQMHQVLMNLATNAAHAMRGQSGRLTVELGVLTATEWLCRQLPDLRPGPCVCLRVRDNGHGMDEATLKRVFDPFFTTKGPGEGTGLGLAVVHGIVKNHDGAIEVSSALGQGTEFTIYLPALPVASPVPAAVPPVREDAGARPGQGEHVLFVDDEPALCTVGQKSLERMGFQVTTCPSAIEAFAEFEAHPERYDAVVTDLTMPGMTGMDLAMRILQLKPGAVILLTTGHGGVWTPEAVRRMGIAELIPKPLSPTTLAEAVSRALKARRDAAN